MLICGKILREFIWIGLFFPSIKVPRFINRNFRTWPQPFLPQDNLHSWGLAARWPSGLEDQRVAPGGLGDCPGETLVFLMQTQRQLVRAFMSWCPLTPHATISRGSSKKEGRSEMRQGWPPLHQEEHALPQEDVQKLPEMPWSPASRHVLAGTERPTTFERLMV